MGGLRSGGGGANLIPSGACSPWGSTPGRGLEDQGPLLPAALLAPPRESQDRGAQRCQRVWQPRPESLFLCVVLDQEIQEAAKPWARVQAAISHLLGRKLECGHLGPHSLCPAGFRPPDLGVLRRTPRSAPPHLQTLA